MKNPSALFIAVCISLALCSCNQTNEFISPDNHHKQPNDWLYLQRAYPNGYINHDLHIGAIHKKKAIEKLESRNNAYWELEGPINIGGRITDVEMHPSSLNIIYAGTASGGIFKSEDQGESWIPIFDDALSLSIGDLAIAPSDSSIIYAGTGESNGGGGSIAYRGVGMYKSMDSGNTWDHIGLDSIGTVGKVLVHPEDPNKLWVAAMGTLFENSPHRGVYHSSNGGQDWEKVLFVSDSTGAIDLAIDPNQPNILYAAMWERIRRPQFRKYGGPTCGIYRSIDSGVSWAKLDNDLPDENIGRIGLAIDPSNSGRLYSMFVDEIGFHKDIYESVDYGDSWTSINSDSLSTYNISFGWWFGRLYVHPTNPETLFAFNIFTYRTQNGGEKWDNVNYNDSVLVHVDPHALYIHPQNPDFIVLGNDGGIYISNDGGDTWTHKENLPITQFYTCEIDPSNPEIFYGGSQDNGTLRTLSGNINDWEQILGGDGMLVKVDPSDHNTIYAAYQNGFLFKSTDGGNSFSFALLSIPNWWIERRNWKTPYALYPNNPQRIIYGTQRLYESTDGASSWEVVAPDLTGNPIPQTEQFAYGTITSISISPIDSNIIYVGTDNGRVWNTLNGAGLPNWNLLSQDLPNRWVTSVAAHPSEPNKAYVTFSGYREANYLPHVFKTIDNGYSWIDISADLPEIPVNDILIDPNIQDRLYIATDAGVYYSLNDGDTWELLGLGLPNVPVIDLCFDNENRKLVAASYGRSLQSISLDDALSNPVINSAVGKIDVFPNPAKENVNIKFIINRDSYIDITLFDTAGNLIKKLFVGNKLAGEHIHKANLKQLPNGVYICNIRVDNTLQSKSLIKI